MSRAQIELLLSNLDLLQNSSDLYMEPDVCPEQRDGYTPAESAACCARFEYSFEPSDIPKYARGTLLRFNGTAPDEAHVPSQFPQGALLVVEKWNDDMGIMVRRYRGRKIDMVWPTEVSLVRE